ncbi:MAG TPA: dTDP-4-dehydrorhamnose 3,5-epimerase family protein [Dongiaceae bacterium]|nr:dTDP-4-dehydrorhamnose 3,5-epimerase family protein [Dongiaceae bacterium]
MNQSISLPSGVRLESLTTHSDDRGTLTEVFRNEWHRSPPPVQWIVSRSEPNVMRGVHVHLRNWDYVCAVEGEVIIGLHDMLAKRPAVPAGLVRMSDARLQVLVIPPGIAHGFYSSGPCTLLLGASTYYDPADHLACRWDSHELGLDWPCKAPELSARDRDAEPYSKLKARLRTEAETAGG